MIAFAVAIVTERDVAQFGSALDWGSRGRRFKSCRPDQNTQTGLEQVA